MSTENALSIPGPDAADSGCEGEGRLVGRARLGDAAAFEALYRSHVGRIHALCLRLAGNRPAAEDLTQEVFVRAWRKLSSFRGAAAFGTWLYRLAVNVAVDELRSTRRGPAAEPPGEADTLHALPPVQDRRELGLDLERAIAELPHSSRMVFVLHDIAGWRHDEIARALDIAVGTARTHLHHARTRLREVLQ